MKRIIIKRYAGSVPNDPNTARRLARKIRGAIAQRECLLVDFEGTNPSFGFLEILLEVTTPTKVRFCGLCPVDQQRVTDHQQEMM